MSGLIEHLLSDLAQAESRFVELQQFAASRGLTPDMLRALRNGRTQLGEDSLGRLLVAVQALHSCGRPRGVFHGKLVVGCPGCDYEREVFAYLFERGTSPRITRPRKQQRRTT